MTGCRVAPATTHCAAPTHTLIAVTADGTTRNILMLGAALTDPGDILFR